MKRKSDYHGDEEVNKRNTGVICILHVDSIHHGDFTPFCNVKGSYNDKLAQLHNIRERRLMEPKDSPNRMEDVCNQISRDSRWCSLKSNWLPPRLLSKFYKKSRSFKE